MNIHMQESQSRLKQHPIAFEDRAINHIIEVIEERVRTMCRAMQAFIDFEERNAKGKLDSFSNLAAFSQIFYEYLDGKMNELNVLHSAIDAECTWLTLNTIRERKHFIVRQPRDKFLTDEAYAQYCNFYGFRTGATDDLHDDAGEGDDQG